MIGQCRSLKTVLCLDTEELPDDLTKETFRSFHDNKQLELPVASFQELPSIKRIEINQKLLMFEKEAHGGNINEAICCLKVYSYQSIAVRK